MKFFRLDGKTPVPCDDFQKWVRRFADDDRQVAFDQVGEVEISTVFLGIDHSLGRGKPLLFETMVFGGPDSGWCRRYTTWDDAEKGHATTVEAERLRRTHPDGSHAKST